MRTKGSRFNLLALISICMVLSLLSCGGGGDDGDDGGTSTNSYTGPTTAAEINQNNAVAVSTDALSGSEMGASLAEGIAGVQSQEDATNIYSRNLLLSQTLIKAIQRIDSISIQENNIMGAVQSESLNEAGPCGGSLTGSLSVDDQTGSFTGIVTWNAYCDEGVTISGSVSASGKFNLSTRELDQFYMIFTNLTFQGQGDSVTINGNINMNFDYPTTTVTENFDIRDNNTGKVYRLENYVMSFTEEGNDTSVVVSGKFYSPDYGYVILSTQTPLMIHSYESNPYEGVLIFKGKTGIAGGSTQARLTFLSSTTFEVDADINGDGSYDWSSGQLYWSDF